MINEGERTKISAINFSGNKRLFDGRLASVLQTKESGMLSFLTRKDVYNEDKLRADEESLVSSTTTTVMPTSASFRRKPS